MNYTYRPPNMNPKSNARNVKIVRRMMIAFVIFLLLNLIFFLPPVQEKVENFFFSDMKTAGMLENKGIVLKEDEQITDEAIKGCLESCLIQVRQQDRQGSGVIWDINETEVILATAAHVASEPEETAEVTFYNGRQMTAEVAYTAENADLVFLKISMESLENMDWVDYTYVRLDEGEAEGSLKSEDDLVLFQDNSEVIRAKVLNPMLYMEDFAENMIWAEAAAVPGMSGGGVFDSSGGFVGILCGGNAQNEIAVLPVSTIGAEYEKSGRSRKS